MKGKGFAGFLLLASLHLLPTSSMAVSAVAVDKAAHKFGYCYSNPTLDEAKQCAVAQCNKSGGKNCQVIDTGVKGGYSAIASGNGQIFPFLASYNDENMVSFYALNACILEVADCNTLTEQCPATSCKIVAKWKEPEAAGQPQSDGSRQQQSQQTPSSATSDQVMDMVNQGHALLNEKHYREAVEIFTQAINADPNNDDICARRGLAYALMEPANYRLALQDLNRAISLNPKNGDAFLLRAAINERAGNKQSSIKDLKMAAQLGNSKAQELLNASGRGGAPQAQQAQNQNSSTQAERGGQAGQVPSPSNSSDSGGLTGMYWCVLPAWSKGTINLLPNGTYEINGAGVAGRYKVGQGQVHFDGSLKSWNNGVARIEDGNLIFEWKNSEGWQQYFAYRK